MSKWVFSDALKESLLSGKLSDLAPVVRLGDARYLRYDSIRIMDRSVEFLYKDNVVAQMNSTYRTEGTLTLCHLLGRLELKIEEG